ncbi:globulin-1 S allele-like [Phragmites australis]|uniref:globulin-1 S allele-like n=1 Tax=Phragmites australis TaxID=29695 RepID=UPI002D7A1A18|nr:globulin-1 S allele-like [Phragmites australis]
MATARDRTTVPFLLLFFATTLCAAAVAASREDHGGREPSLRQCVRRCEEDRPRYQRAQCVQECREREQQEQGRHERDRSGEGPGDEREHEEGGRRPYVFDRRSFRRIVRSEQGSVKALPPFHEASKLLRGIRNYRVVVLEANPRSFIVPSHTDAHCICYVAQGEGVVTTIENGERRSYTIREGYIFVAPAGAVTYLANTDGRRKLVIAKILHTISETGKFQFFFGPGGKNPESVLSSFSKSVQRAAFKTSSDRLERLFGRQDKGIIVRATEEQIRELRRHASEGSHGPHWPLPPFGESHGPYKLLEQQPRIANQHGQLYEADARRFPDLTDHDVRVSLVNITAGSMSAPFYNTRSIKIAYVLEGEGHAEIVCPHLAHGSESEHSHGGGRSERGKGWRREEESEEEEDKGQQREQEEAGQGYQTILARLSRGTAFVVPVGHPVVEVASRDSNLQILCFEVRAEKNEKVYLAGANNVLKQLDDTAKALAFAASAREVDEVLDAQRGQGFLPGPDESGGQEREQEDEHEGRHGRREVVAETLLRMATGGL